METTNKHTMITKGQAGTSNHLWTRVVISGSDMDSLDDSLDEEEVNDVETNTFGRTFNTENESAAGTAPAAPTVSPITPGKAMQNASLFLSSRFAEEQPARNESSTIDVRALFVQTDDTTIFPFGPTTIANNNCSHFDACDDHPGDDMLSNGELITPAVTEFNEEESEESPPTQSSAFSWFFWPFFWGNRATTMEDKQEEEVNDDQVQDQLQGYLVNETSAGVIVVEDDEEERAADCWASVFASYRLVVERWSDCWAAAREMAKGYCLWAKNQILEFWFTLGSLGVLLRALVQNLAAEARNAVRPAMQVWEASSPKLAEAVGPALTVLGLGILIVAMARFYPTKPPATPLTDLRDFVLFEKAHNSVDMKEIDELNTEAFRTYARSTCIQAEALEQARTSLATGLYGVPEAVRSNVVRMAIMEGVSQKNSVQDSNSDFVNSGKADAFMAFWSTVYDPSAGRETYTSCVMVTGVALTVAESIAEWTTKREKYQIGTEPCHCGFVYCEECPVFDVRQVRWPVFERRSLSLRKQEELRRWMVDQAVKSAEHLVLDATDLLRLEEGSTSLMQMSPAFAWTGPTNAAFFGEASHKDRVAPDDNVYGTVEL